MRQMDPCLPRQVGKYVGIVFGNDLRIPRNRPVTSRMVVPKATDACDENFVELLRARADSACWAGRRLASSRLGLSRGHGAG